MCNKLATLLCSHPGVSRGPERLRNWIPAFAGMTTLIFILSAHAEPEDKSPELPAPVLLDVKMPSLPGQAAEAADPFKLAVEEYVGRNDKAALAHLKDALRLKRDDDRAKQLLLKVYLRMMREKYEAKQYKEAWSILKDSRAYFPSHPDLELMGRSIAQQIPEVQAEMKPKKEPPVPLAVKTARVQAAAPARTAAPVGTPSASPEQPIIVKVSSPQPAKQPWGRSPGDWILAALGAVLLAAVGALAYLLKQNQTALGQQAMLFQQMLSREKEQRDEMAKKMDMELELVKRLQEAVEQNGRTSVRDAGGGVYVEGRGMGPSPAGGRPPAPRSPHMDKLLVSRQKKQIMDVLVNITPPEREQKEESIAAQAQSLYEISPVEAVKFLEGLARDESPLIRAIIMPALAKISTDATLDLLLALRGDKDAGVQRAAYKQLKILGQADPGTLLPGHFQKINAALHEEVSKGEWIL